MSEIKPCKVCNFTRQKYHGVVVVSLSQLKVKGRQALGCGADAAVSVLLDDDGTVVEDDAYFLCLPPNSKFMLLQDGETWKPAKRYDGGTAWLRQSFDAGADAVDGAAEPWRSLADQLRRDLASIILMSEADLESLVGAPSAALASALAFPEQKAQDLQGTLQRVLDRREEERQSKELLRLYLKEAQEEAQEEAQRGEAAPDGTDGTAPTPAAGFNPRTLQVLRSKSSPETRLSDEELQAVLKQGVEPLTEALRWDRDRAAALLQTCEEELRKRLRQVQAMRSLSAQTPAGGPTPAFAAQPRGDESTAKRRK